MAQSPTRLRFTPRVLPTIAACLAFALTAYLGYWQQGRAEEKRNLQRIFDARAGLPAITVESASMLGDEARFRRAFARGVFDAAGQIFVDNKMNGSTVGYHVIAPLKLADDNRYLLVNRGFVSRSPNYPTVPTVAVPTGEVLVTGQLVKPNQKFLELTPDAVQGQVWQNLTVERYRQAKNRQTLDWLLLIMETDTQLKPVVEKPDARVEKHIEYMLTWYSLAATALVLWVMLNLQFNKTETT